MDAKTLFPCALVLAVLSADAARAQDPPPPSGALAPYSAPAPPGLTELVPPPGSPTPIPGQLSSWIAYPRPGCCGPLGDPPIATEIFLRLGPSLPVEGGIFDGTLKTGWNIQGGGRVLFFNQPMDAAWYLDLSLSNIYNQGRNPDVTHPFVDLRFDPPFPGPVTVRNLNRTYFNWGLGREWYWSMPAHTPQSKLRFGWEVGGRWGTGRLELFEIQHLTDTFYGLFLALHTDWEIPCGCCTFLTGFRAEWDYTWTDILPPNDTNLQDVNLLVTAGVRF
jgi:hypothetical protein